MQTPRFPMWFLSNKGETPTDICVIELAKPPRRAALLYTDQQRASFLVQNEPGCGVYVPTAVFGAGGLKTLLQRLEQQGGTHVFLDRGSFVEAFMSISELVSMMNK